MIEVSIFSGFSNKIFKKYTVIDVHNSIFMDFWICLYHVKLEGDIISDFKIHLKAKYQMQLKLPLFWLPLPYNPEKKYLKEWFFFQYTSCNFPTDCFIFTH